MKEFLNDDYKSDQYKKNAVFCFFMIYYFFGRCKNERFRNKKFKNQKVQDG